MLYAGVLSAGGDLDFNENTTCLVVLLLFVVLFVVNGSFLDS